MEMDPRGTNDEIQKLGHRVIPRSRDPILEFWDPLLISGTVEAINSKFGTQMGPDGN